MPSQCSLLGALGFFQAVLVLDVHNMDGVEQAK